MIIFYDHNYPPLAIFEINSFLENDYKTFTKIFDNILEKSIKKKEFINIYIDLYKLEDYSIYTIKDITYYFTYLTATQLQFINTINIYIKKDDNYFISFLKNIQDYAIMKINIIQSQKKHIWKKFII
tara:strand:+ start:3823 stop:4203 length:381 start_codon:yes stop_codon:yes gene_type:complete